MSSILSTTYVVARRQVHGGDLAAASSSQLRIHAPWDEASKVPDCVQRINPSECDSASSDIDDLQGVELCGLNLVLTVREMDYWLD